jgi:hypothetical protein
MDREFGTWTPTENQARLGLVCIHVRRRKSEMMCYQIRTGAEVFPSFQDGALLKDGEFTPLGRKILQSSRAAFGKVPNAAVLIPSGWNIKVPNSIWI